ncbi:proline-rich protein 29 isoform X1 [Anser cygnoides]|uniref:proline-rich protein 29 isoform X1 n=1 Tax=Anser cygnoides TaxID=8845 RepID=UPI0034D2397A
MEVRAAGDPKGVWGDPAAGTYIIPQGIPPVPCPHGAVPVSQQPVVILQQLPGTLAQPTRAPHLREDLIELMMIQNSQMYQVVMNSLAVSALTSFGFGPSPAAAQPLMVPLQTGEEEEAMVFHHHYVPYASPTPILAWPVPAGAGGPVVMRYQDTAAEDGEPATSSTPQCHRDRRSQCPTIIRVLRHAGAAAVSSLHPEVASPARPWPPPQKILCVPRVGALWY